jgi:SnoaL-like domain
MKNVTPDQQTMLATWQQHTYAEFVLKDADAAPATMTENLYVLFIASGVVLIGRAAVREFYADTFLPNIPPDFEITTVSQTVGDDRVVEEMAIRFTHTMDLDWLLPGVRPTGRKAEFSGAAFIWQQNRARARLLGSRDGAVSIGCPGSSAGGGRNAQCRRAFETSVTSRHRSLGADPRRYSRFCQNLNRNG